MKIYIAGPVTGINYDKVYEKFTKIEIFLRNQGYDVINPIRLVKKNTDWITAMRICLNEIINNADGIYMLDGWQNSKGASLEFIIAHSLNIPVRFENKSLYPLF